jgi:hypothetical protein
MAYTFNVNNASASDAANIKKWGDAVTTAGWTITASGVGNTAGGGAQDFPAAAPYFEWNLSWIVLKHPTQAWYFCLQRVQGNGVSTFRIKHSKIGFSGGSPSATQVPSATDEVVMLGAGTDASPTGGTLLPATGRANMVTGGSSESYAWIFFGNAAGASGLTWVFYFDPMVASTYPSEDTEPFVTYRAASATNIFLVSAFQNDANIKGWVPNSQTLVSVWRSIVACQYVAAHSSNLVCIPGNIGQDQITGNDLLFPVPYARQGDFSAIPGPPCWKGFSTLLSWVGGNRNFGDTITTSSTKDRLVLGSTSATTTCAIAIPWNGTDLTI